jgi:hypothetical protein
MLTVKTRSQLACRVARDAEGDPEFNLACLRVCQASPDSARLLCRNALVRVVVRYNFCRSSAAL